MKIVVGFLRSPEGRVAPDRAIDEAKLRNTELIVVHTAQDHPNEVTAYQREFEEVEHRLELRA